MTDPAYDTCPCGLCGKPTPMTATKRCDGCWELERRVLAQPDLARKILAAVTPAAPSDAEIAALVEAHGHATMPYIISRLRRAFARAALSQTMQPQAEPAAGEQAGAVVRSYWACRTDYTDKDNGWDGWEPCATGYRERCKNSPGFEWMEMHPLAAPGAAIAAREQEGDWQIDHSAGRPVLTCKNCSVIEAEDAEYVMRLIAADRVSRNGAPDTPQAKEPKP